MTTARLDALKWQLEEYGGGLPTSECRELIVALETALARAERAEKALEQAIDAGSLAILTISDDEKGYGLWKYRGETIIVGQSSTENFFGGHLEECPELAAYLRAKEVE